MLQTKFKGIKRKQTVQMLWPIYTCVLASCMMPLTDEVCVSVHWTFAAQRDAFCWWSPFESKRSKKKLQYFYVAFCVRDFERQTVTVEIEFSARKTCPKCVQETNPAMKRGCR